MWVISKRFYLTLFLLLAAGMSSAQQVPDGFCAIIVASRQNLTDAKLFMTENPTLGVKKVYKAPNGWLAISVGNTLEDGSGDEIARLVSQGKVPTDTYCSSGKSYRGVVWSAGEEVPRAYPHQSEFARLFDDIDASALSWDDKRFLQTALAFEGHYNGLLDGAWGRLSESALHDYSIAEFGTRSENWHLATLAFSLFERTEADGWDMRYFDGLRMSILIPEKTLVRTKDSQHFVNYNHLSSSLSISIGVHGRATASSIHDYVLDTHSLRTAPYTVRKSGLAVSSTTQSGGTVLYARSNFIDGAWSTIMVSASRNDKNLLNAVTASLDVGRAATLRFTAGGRLDQVVNETIALVQDFEKQNSPPQEAVSQPTTQGEDAQAERAGSSGSGFFVSKLGHVVTNAHVVDSCNGVFVDGKPASLVDVSKDFDLALLLSAEAEVTEVAKFANGPAGLNADVTAVGYPYSGYLGGLNVTRGSVSATRGLGGDATRMQITAPVQSGNSGGPLLASNGSVVGVVVSKLNALEIADVLGDLPQNVNYAVRGEIAKLFLAQNGVSPETSANNSAVEPEKLAKIATGFTAFVECK